MSFTMEDFNRQYVKEHFRKLTAEERQEVLQSLPPEEAAKLCDRCRLRRRRKYYSRCRRKSAWRACPRRRSAGISTN
jgi:hypothetical protein